MQNFYAVGKQLIENQLFLKAFDAPNSHIVQRRISEHSSCDNDSVVGMKRKGFIARR